MSSKAQDNQNLDDSDDYFSEDYEAGAPSGSNKRRKISERGDDDDGFSSDENDDGGGENEEDDGDKQLASSSGASSVASSNLVGVFAPCRSGGGGGGGGGGRRVQDDVLSEPSIPPDVRERQRKFDDGLMIPFPSEEMKAPAQLQPSVHPLSMMDPNFVLRGQFCGYGSEFFDRVPQTPDSPPPVPAASAAAGPSTTTTTTTTTTAIAGAVSGAGASAGGRSGAGTGAGAGPRSGAGPPPLLAAANAPDCIAISSRRSLDDKSLPAGCTNGLKTTYAGVPKMLAINGIAIVEDVLTPTEVKQARDGLWASLAQMTSQWPRPIERDMQLSGNMTQKLQARDGYIFERNGIGHAKFAWDVRSNPNVIKVFMAAFTGGGVSKVSDLVPTFEGIHVMTGGAVRKPVRAVKLFCNSTFHSRGWENRYYQGEVVIYGMDKNRSSTLVFMRGSHLHHDEFRDKFGVRNNTSSCVKIRSNEEYKFFKDKGCECMALNVKAGSVVIWNPRLIQGMAAASDVGDNATGFKHCDPTNQMYAGIPLSMAKAVDLPTLVKKRKRGIFEEEHRMVSHYPWSVAATPYCSTASRVKKPSIYKTVAELPDNAKSMMLA
eukprot:3833255-Rhodomonas_salina.2